LALNAVFAYFALHLQVFAWRRRRWARLAEKRKCLDQCDDLLSGELVGQVAPTTTGQRRRARDRGEHTNHYNRAGPLAASAVGDSSHSVGRVFTAGLCRNADRVSQAERTRSTTAPRTPSCYTRGRIDVKGKGVMRTWYLVGRKPVEVADSSDVLVEEADTAHV
jgi:hypothetical protein